MSDPSPSREVVTVDVLSVGSGPGGLIAALVARSAGLDALVIEKSDYVGGTSAHAFGGIWFADHALMRRAGQPDSVAEALTYLEHVVGEAGPAATKERQEAYFRAGQRMIPFLEDRGVRFVPIQAYPDYFPEAPGGKQAGRVFDLALFDANELGPWRDWVRPRPPMPFGLLVPTMEEFRTLALSGTGLGPGWAALGTVARSFLLRLRGTKPLVFGASYIGQLLLAAQRDKVRFSLHTPMRELIVEAGRVVGAVAERGGRPVEIRARAGVLLNTGGFSQNAALREKFGPEPSPVPWTFMIPEDTGDAYNATAELGAATANLDESYWLPGLIGPDGRRQMMLPERHQPHTIIVDSSGTRYVNEAVNYMSMGRAMYERHRTVAAVPSWLILDSHHRRRYPLGFIPPRVSPRAWLASGHLRRADTLELLAKQCGIDPLGLRSTVERFNEMAARGVDKDFHRGESAYDRTYGDPSVTPNPCLGTIARPPFYAAQVVPSDVGMAGGLVTDSRGGVLREDGTWIEGLYACGTAAASSMGRVYPGGGISLGQSSAFGFLAAEDMSGI